MKKSLFLITLSFYLFATLKLEAQLSVPKMESVDFSHINIMDEFWSPRIKKVTTVSIPHLLEEAEGNIKSFEKVAANKGEKSDGIFFSDSDLYKVLEGLAYSLKNHPDPELEKKMDLIIDKIAAAQMPDGYLNTYFQLGNIKQRWTNAGYHETYCAGHLIEAAVAYYNVTGKRKLLDVGIRFADHIDSTFKQQGRNWVPGHQEIELALVKLSQTVNDKKYLDLAEWFLERRGHGYRDDYGSYIGDGGIVRSRKYFDEYSQDFILKENTNVTGHAVRAMYLYAGAAAVMAAKKDTVYMDAIKQLWEDVVYRNMYVTGAIGSSSENEGFSNDYELPNEKAYAESCASIGMVFWNNWMNLLTGESKYADVLERSLYNGALDGLSLSGDEFFYRNPLTCSGGDSRSPALNCCSSNLTRFIESVGDYVYAKTDEALWVNLFVGSAATLKVKNRNVEIRQETNYPWDGKVRMSVSPEKSVEFDLHVRIPGWVNNQAVPGDAYRYLENTQETFSLFVNGKLADYKMVGGYALIRKTWKKGDVVVLDMPMPVRRIIANEKIKENHNRVALQRGPLVYCFEYVDNGGKALNIVVPDDITFTAEFQPGLLGGVTVLKGQTPVATVSPDGLNVSTVKREVKAIPYYTWNNRGKGQMQVWLPRKITDIRVIVD